MTTAGPTTSAPARSPDAATSRTLLHSLAFGGSHDGPVPKPTDAVRTRQEWLARPIGRASRADGPAKETGDAAVALRGT